MSHYREIADAESADHLAALEALNEEPAPAVTVREVAKAIFDASTFCGDWEGQPKSNIEVCESMARAAIRAIAGGGDE